MDNKLKTITLRHHAIYSFFFVSIVGTLLHFFYDWSGQNDLVGFISAVNESTWEHMKLMFLPMLIYALFMWLKFHNTIPSAFPAFATAALIAVFVIPVFFYTYTGIIGFNVNAVDIFIFYLSTFIGCWSFYKIATRYDYSQLNLILFLIHVMLLIMFIFFTYNPPGLGIFISPV